MPFLTSVHRATTRNPRPDDKPTGPGVSPQGVDQEGEAREELGGVRFPVGDFDRPLPTGAAAAMHEQRRIRRLGPAAFPALFRASRSGAYVLAREASTVLREMLAPYVPALGAGTPGRPPKTPGALRDALTGILHSALTAPDSITHEDLEDLQDGLRWNPEEPDLCDRALAAAADGPQGRPVLAVTATGREAEDLAAALRSLLPPDTVAEFPAWETLPHERLSPRSDTVGRRLAVLRRIVHPSAEDPAAGPVQVVVAPVRSVLQPQVKGLADLEPVALQRGEQHDLEEVAGRLAAAAYSRVELVERVIRPALAEGNVVICDRFLLANVVYQGHAGGLDVASLWQVGSAVIGGLRPDVTVVLDLPVEQAVARRGRVADRMEARDLDYRERVRAGFLAEAHSHPDIRVIDASPTLEYVRDAIRDVIPLPSRPD